MTPGLTYLSNPTKPGADGGEQKGQPDGGAATAIAPLRRVRGISSDLNDLFVRGFNWKAALGDSLLNGTLTRTTKGASVLKLTIGDKRALLKSPLMLEKHVVNLDGLAFRFVAVNSPSMNGPDEFTYEPLVVAKLREILGPHKAFRDLMTRAEFAKRLAFMVTPQPTFVCPQLHTIEKIESPKQAKEVILDAEERREKGVSKHNLHLKVKGSAATSAQVTLGNEAGKIAESENAPFRVMVALFAALIAESEMGRASSNILQGTAGKAKGVQHDITGFLTGKGWTSQAGGAIGYFKANPTAKPYEIAQAVQASGAGEASNGRDNYGAVEAEAVEWVEAYGGSASETVETTERYAFQQAADKDNWTEMVDLAEEVHWRCFESAGWIYFIAEPDLLRSTLRMTIRDYAPGVQDTQLKYDEGKEVQEITVEARATAWEAPPGSVVNVLDHGPGDGIYIVEKIEAPLARRNSLCKITLNRPTVPLLEPAAQTSTKSIGGFSGSTGNSSQTPSGAPAAIDAMLAEMEKLTGTPYLYGAGHGSTFETSPPKLDCSGAMSLVLHAGGFLNAPAASPAMMSMFEAGRGDWFVLYANAEHVFCEIKTKSGWREWEEGGVLGSRAGFLAAGSHPKTGFVARHPKGT
jgi:cell wall-associated NlpC family hydrolase